jgi:hypothetical protein
MSVLNEFNSEESLKHKFAAAVLKHKLAGAAKTNFKLQ